MGKKTGKRTGFFSLLVLLIVMGTGCGNNAVDPVSTDTQVSSNDPFANLNNNSVANDSFDDVSEEEDAVEMDAAEAEVVSNPTDSDIPVITTQPEEVSSNSSTTLPINEVTEVNNNIYIANMSGKNIDSLYFTFHVDSMNEVEILGEESLKDGNLFTYEASDMTTLLNQPNLTLSIRGVLHGGEELSFGTVNVINPSGMTLVLCTGEEGYSAYID